MVLSVSSMRTQPVSVFGKPMLWSETLSNSLNSTPGERKHTHRIPIAKILTLADEARVDRYIPDSETSATRHVGALLMEFTLFATLLVAMKMVGASKSKSQTFPAKQNNFPYRARY